MLDKEAAKLREEFKESVYVPQEATLMNHDNPSRRIALYDVIGSKTIVEEFFTYVPLKGFIGEMSVYDAYVSKKESRSAPASSDNDDKKSDSDAKKK